MALANKEEVKVLQGWQGSQGVDGDNGREAAKKVSSPTDVDDWMGKSNSTPPISQSNNRERTQSEMKMNIEKTISVLLGQIQTSSCYPLSLLSINKEFDMSSLRLRWQCKGWGWYPLDEIQFPCFLVFFF